jgi:hypothetical protein
MKAPQSSSPGEAPVNLQEYSRERRQQQQRQQSNSCHEHQSDQSSSPGEASVHLQEYTTKGGSRSSSSSSGQSSQTVVMNTGRTSPACWERHMSTYWSTADKAAAVVATAFKRLS